MTRVSAMEAKSMIHEMMKEFDDWFQRLESSAYKSRVGTNTWMLDHYYNHVMSSPLLDEEAQIILLRFQHIILLTKRVL